MHIPHGITNSLFTKMIEECLRHDLNQAVNMLPVDEENILTSKAQLKELANICNKKIQITLKHWQMKYLWSTFNQTPASHNYMPIIWHIYFNKAKTK